MLAKISLPLMNQKQTDVNIPPAPIPGSSLPLLEVTALGNLETDTSWYVCIHHHTDGTTYYASNQGIMWAPNVTNTTIGYSINGSSVVNMSVASSSGIINLQSKQLLGIAFWRAARYATLIVEFITSSDRMAELSKSGWVGLNWTSRPRTASSTVYANNATTENVIYKMALSPSGSSDTGSGDYIFEFRVSSEIGQNIIISPRKTPYGSFNETTAEYAAENYLQYYPANNNQQLIEELQALTEQLQELSTVITTMKNSIGIYFDKFCSR